MRNTENYLVYRAYRVQEHFANPEEPATLDINQIVSALEKLPRQRLVQLSIEALARLAYRRQAGPSQIVETWATAPTRQRLASRREWGPSPSRTGDDCALCTWGQPCPDCQGSGATVPGSLLEMALPPEMAGPPTSCGTCNGDRFVVPDHCCSCLHLGDCSCRPASHRRWPAFIRLVRLPTLGGTHR